MLWNLILQNLTLRLVKLSTLLTLCKISQWLNIGTLLSLSIMNSHYALHRVSPFKLNWGSSSLILRIRLDCDIIIILSYSCNSKMSLRARMFETFCYFSVLARTPRFLVKCGFYKKKNSVNYQTSRFLTVKCFFIDLSSHHKIH